MSTNVYQAWKKVLKHIVQEINCTIQMYRKIYSEKDSITKKVLNVYTIYVSCKNLALNVNLHEIYI